MPLSDPCRRKLQSIVGPDHFLKEEEDRACYAYDATAMFHMPDAVVFPKNARQVSEILILANQEGFCVTPRGHGSGMTGGSLPVEGGVALVMTRMSRILEIDTDNLTAHVETGVVTGRLHRAAEKKGLFYPPDPASSDFSTIGGNLGECAGGPRAVKYGVTRDYVLGLEVVLPTGEIIHTGVKTAKGVTGYDLARLFVGSEGTLGVITRAVLKLLPLPETIRTMSVVFDAMEDAAETVSEVIRKGIIPRAIEFMDNASIRCAEAHIGAGLPTGAGAMLIIETDGKKDEAENAVRELERLCLAGGRASSVRVAETPAEAEKLWKARKAVSPALFNYGSHKINEDIVVPRSRIPDMIRKINELREKTGLFMASFGHAGDGNIHFNIMLDKNNRDEMKKAEKTIEIIFDHTLALGGTLSGEHGVGVTKASHLPREIGATERALMRNIKKLFDPRNVLNPSKIFQPEGKEPGGGSD
ncbi:Glycolate oxidase subunit GlcD [Candidatus Desulfarcum epimagneticum]|uniref:Glycolate oxidase subunit GlcD n=1 Tax=uncultured Desulfobacteraceae bacterium TaxID=218296 RepID=A0A484HEH2_9BACT|nr:Glycolate oxidase subunit GlcD [uncultured Desulfobacteraceae bacterium]